MAKFIEKSFKSILNKRRYIDSWFWDRYSINPYNGCQFGCVYCDARTDRYHMPEDFENQIVVKTQVEELLDGRLTRARTLLPDVVVLSGVTDCYQPAEKKFGNTKSCLQVLRKHDYPVHIVTKSLLVERDLELINDIAEQNWATISITLTTLDSRKAAFLDGKSPSPCKRLELVEKIRTRYPRIHCGILAIPLVPYLSDSEGDLRALVDSVQVSGASYLLFGGGMSMRDSQAIWFLERLREYDPAVFQKYQSLYQIGESGTTYRGLSSPPKSYLRKNHAQLLDLCKHVGLAVRIPRYLPSDFRRLNYQIAEILLNEAYIRQMSGRAWQNRFWAGQNIQNLDRSIVDYAQENSLTSIRNVDLELANWIRSNIKAHALPN